MDNPEDLIYCAVCGKPIYDGDRTVNFRRGGQVSHSECFLKIFKAENITVEEDENGDGYYQIEVDDEDLF